MNIYNFHYSNSRFVNYISKFTGIDWVIVVFYKQQNMNLSFKN